MENELHAHVDTYSTDCDGPIVREYVETMNDDERQSEFGDIEFHNRMVAYAVTSYSSYRGGDLSVSVDDEYGNVTLRWSEPTEEGGRSSVTRFCTDDCDTLETHYRDIRAEEAGY